MNWKTTTSGLILFIFAAYLFYLHVQTPDSDILATGITSAVAGIGLITAKDGSNRS